MDQSARTRLQQAQREFTPHGTYLNSATHGLTPHAARRALEEHTHEVATGRFSPGAHDPGIERTRAAYARLAGVTADRVAIGTHVAQFTGTIAASLPIDAEVLVPEHEFSSTVHPFAARGDLRVREVPLARLADEVRPTTALVAVSAAQSADGSLAPLEDLLSARADHGTRLLVDTTQSAGWLPLDGARLDYVVCSPYKWLLGTRGSAFLAGTDEALAELRPLAANWYSAAEPWNSLYGASLTPAAGARRLDLAPVWSAFVSLEHSLALIERVGVETIHEHDVALADRFRDEAGLAGGGSAIVSLPAPEGTAERLAEAGVTAAVRGGRLRVSFHLYNTEADVDRLVEALAALR
ncbi:aminotransferase class V-fold PLP-dependent enzyme [Nocardiopsis sp. MG754419]|uniref:aminotransferase class V-fold PLP-dependent enzyme n=1 Tax=Nocardiopsis sp. MG754419 TaxID=2259865 RepID=UPI001BA579B8|nr:aminotransferase class V-fold PLP-dependent enzyme [Nocardiopsis sp. MG754419]MBR8743253.1 aminotransferase [Nocardiopsis sp. MG754419]